MPDLVFKIVDRASWYAVPDAAPYDGSPLDARDGFIHLSSAAQVRDTAARYFAGRPDLLLVAVDAASLGGALRWEPSRNGEPFPHLYGPLPRQAVRWVAGLPLDADAGTHVFPGLDS
jgi:uncharacterized protein (DUF952 family)